MHLLIDGHNLIGSNLFPDIRLSDEDDEAKLVRRLKIWQSRTRTSMTVIFDRGIPGGINVRMGSSGVEVVFAAHPAQADDLIRRRLRKARQGLILVTNDEALLREAAVYRVKSWRGTEFIEYMKPRIPERSEEGTEEEIHISKAEVEEWLALFRARAAAKKALKKRAKPPAGDTVKTTKRTQQPERPSPKKRKDSGKRR
jgi:predicted RNA-binding protein with PIN domain